MNNAIIDILAQKFIQSYIHVGVNVCVCVCVCSVKPQRIQTFHRKVIKSGISELGGVTCFFYFNLVSQKVLEIYTPTCKG